MKGRTQGFNSQKTELVLPRLIGLIYPVQFFSNIKFILTVRVDNGQVSYFDVGTLSDSQDYEYDLLNRWSIDYSSVDLEHRSDVSHSATQLAIVRELKLGKTRLFQF
jgi:hypothetical protein